MKKLFFGTIITMLLLSVVLPLSANAATLSASRDTMTVGQEVLVTVTTDAKAEAIQFDLNFDNTKYTYVSNSQESTLDSTKSHLLEQNMVRVSAFDENGDSTNKVTLKFKATNAGTSKPFSIKNKTVLVNENGQETFAKAEVLVKRIGEDKKSGNGSGNGNGNSNGGAPYVDAGGQAITTLPQTGDPSAKSASKNYVAKYSNLLASNTIALPYALSNPYPLNDGKISVDEVNSDFAGKTITITNDGKAHVRTGDTATEGGTTYTIIVYGDLNKDGVVTTGDALALQKHANGSKVINDEVVLEAADINNNGTVDKEDAYAIQNFVLGLRSTPKTDNKIIDEYPYEINASEITITDNITAGAEYNKFSTNNIANVSSNKTLEDVSYEYELVKAPNGVNTKGSIVEKDPNASSNALLQIDGSGNIEFTPSVSGEYQIKVIVKGNAIEGRKVEKTLNAVNIKEDYSVNKIKVGENNKISFRVNETITPIKINYYHQYSADNLVPVTPADTSLTGFEVSIVNISSSNITSSLYGEGGALITSSNLGLNIDAIGVTGQVPGTYTFDIQVKKENGIDVTCTETITVEIKDAAAITDLCLDDSPLADGSTINCPIYDGNPGISGNKNWIVKDGKTIVEKDGTYFTLLNLGKKDEDLKTMNLLGEDITNITYDDGLVTFGEVSIGADAGVLINLEIKPFIFDGNNYNEANSTTEEILVGIGMMSGGDVDSINQGVKILSSISKYTNGINLATTVVSVTSRINEVLDSEVPEALVTDNSQTNNKEEVTVSKAEVTTLPTVKENKLDYSKAELTLTMSDGTTKKVALTEKMVKLAAYDKDATTPQEVKATVTYEGKEVTTFKVTLAGKVQEKSDDNKTNTATDSTNSVDPVTPPVEGTSDSTPSGADAATPATPETSDDATTTVTVPEAEVGSSVEA